MNYTFVLPLLTLSTFLSSLALGGPHDPATTPALPPAEAQKKFTVPEGFEVRLFAAEPDVINPVAMTWDERGRLWVLELYEYPLGAKKGEKGRDRIKILEDTDGDGRADKVSVFADGFSLATGLLLGNGGVYVGQAPDFLFLEDTNGDDVADKRTVLKTGFGMQDRHELLNGFAWGPDGWLYMTHGVFTYSTVKDPNDPTDDGVKMNAAVARYHPRTKKFEVFAEGTSNPWGIDFDRYGNAFVTACVIDHLFHIVQGGSYQRQAGTPSNPYTYELLPSIVKHKHQRAAYAGVCVYQGDNFPEEYRGTVFMGNIHGNCINNDKLLPNGSSWRAEPLPDFLSANDGWFRPVSEQVGPDGALWIMDWYDKYPCYQNANADPAGVDRAHGRIWRVVYTGKARSVLSGSEGTLPPAPRGMNFAKASTAELVKLLEHSNVWQRRMAQRILTERQDEKSKLLLKKMLADGKMLESRLAALCTLHSSDQLDNATLETLVKDKEPAMRAWVARFTGDKFEAIVDKMITAAKNKVKSEGTVDETMLLRLNQLCGDTDPTVRLAVAIAARRIGTGFYHVYSLIGYADAATDPLLPFANWMALEKEFDNSFSAFFSAMAKKDAGLYPAHALILRKTTRRIADTNKPELLDEVVKFLEAEKDDSVTLAALNGLLDGKRKSLAKPTVPTTPVLQKLIASANPEISDRAKRLAALWGDTAAAEVLLAHINDPKASDEQRIEAIGVARQLKSEKSREALLTALANDRHRVEVIQALGEVGGDAVAAELLKRWKDFSPESRRAVLDVLASRPAWAIVLLQSLSSRQTAGGQAPFSNPTIADLHPSAIRTLARYDDKTVRELFAKTIGKFRETSADKTTLIAAKRKVVLAGAVDFKAGRELTAKTCLVCHKLNDAGAEVGPDLTGSGRASLDALLANVIDPNQIIGKGYEQVEVTTKDDRSISGRLVEDTPNHVKLLSAGPKEEIIAKSEIASQRVSELSVMPEALEQLPDADFRSLIWFVLLAPKVDLPPTTAEALAKLNPHLLTSSSSSKPKESWSRAGNLNGSIIDGKPETIRVTFDNSKKTEDWFAIEFEAPREIVRIVYCHGKTFHDGGWFDTSGGKPKIQIKASSDAAWKTVATLDTYPDTTTEKPPDLKNGQRFEGKLANRVTAVAVRIVGKPSSGDNPAQSFSSCAELQIYGE